MARPNPTFTVRRIAAPVLVFVALLAVMTATTESSPDQTPAADLATGTPPPQGDTEALISDLQRAVGADAGNATALTALGDAYLQRLRETGDAAFYDRAERAFEAARTREPRQPGATVGLATLALARHDFRRALTLAERGRELAPTLVLPLAPLADAQIELGRYGAAERTIGRLVTRKPALAAYARVSYFRELHGDLDGAVRAMRLAVSAGGSPEGVAYVTALVGKLELDRGRYGAAERAYRSALAADRDYLPALAGLARVDAARGELGPAIARLRRVTASLPLPEYAIALAEAELAAGRDAAADRDLALVETEAKLLRAAGVSGDVEQAVFEADHGSAARAIALGRRGWERAPSVRSADAYGWALHAAGRERAALRLSREAMWLGSRDPYFLYHAGVIAAAAGETARAEELLGRVVRQSPRFSPYHGPRAERALEALR